MSRLDKLMRKILTERDRALKAGAELPSYVQPATGRACCLFYTASLARLRHALCDCSEKHTT